MGAEKKNSNEKKTGSQNRNKPVTAKKSLADTGGDKFYCIPNKLFSEPAFSNLPLEAYVLYALLYDRYKLSKVNNFTDENGVFIYYTVNEASAMLKLGRAKVIRLFSLLEDSGLIKRKREENFKPAKIYVKSILTERKLLPDMETVLYDDIRNMINYDILQQNYLKEDLDEIVNVIADVLSSTSETAKIGAAEYKTSYIRQRFYSLQAEHVASVLDNYYHSKTKIRNHNAYLKAALFNEPSTLCLSASYDFHHSYQK